MLGDLFKSTQFRTVRQHDAMQCGAACLTAVCRFHGGIQSLEEVSALCHPSTEGVSLKAIADSARILGFETTSARASVDNLINKNIPAILHWKQNHFVVLYKISRNGYRFHLSDPAKGNIRLTRKEFEQHWLSHTSDGVPKGIVLFLIPTEQFKTDSQTSNTHSKGARVLIDYLKKYRIQFLHVLAGIMLGCVLQLVMPFLTQSVVDKGINNRDIGFIWLVLLGELMIVTGRTATDFIRRWMLLHISMRVNLSLVSAFLIKLLKLPMNFFDTRLMGDIMQRIVDHSRVQSFLTGQLLGTTFSLINLIVFGIVLVIYNPLVFGIFIIGSVIYTVWISVFLHRRKILDYERFDCEAHNRNLTYRFVTTMQEIKLQDCEHRRRMEWEDAQADLFSIQMKSLRLQQLQEAGSVFINEIKNILITVLAASSVIEGSMTLGGMLAVQYIIGQLNSPLEQLMGFIYSMQDVKISLERIDEVHRRLEEEDAYGDEILSEGNYDIQLCDVGFKYNPHSPRETLDNVSFNIPAGQVTAIVGASGSGKTTLIKLLLGYYSASKGNIKIAGRNIKEYSMRDWRRRCGVVMQDGVIFSESIARNIAVTDAPIDMTRLKFAAELACIHDHIKSLPLGYDTKIGPDGSGLSQGQKQRILIARAVYKDPDYIFLDEATNSLDALNEHDITKNLEDFFRGRTVVIVAHRLSTVRNADNIVVLDHGRVVESGTHEKLITARRTYFELIRNQIDLGN